jgi:hypothetical protein
MTVELNGAELITAGCIDDAEAAAALTHINSASLCIVTNVVGISRKFYAFDGLERGTVQYVAGPGFCIGDEELIEFGDKTDALRLMKPSDASDAFAGGKVHNLDRVVSQRGNE